MTSFGVPLGDQKSVPERDVEPRQSGLVDGRHVGRRRPARLGQDRERP